MRLLLDTHIVIWSLTDDPRLSDKARLLIEDESNEVLYSTASSWEVAIKHAIHPDKMLMGASEFIDYCTQSGLIQLPICGRHVVTLETIERPDDAAPHNDPFDRIMLAQAKTDGLTLITHDMRIAEYDEPCVLYL